METRMRSVVKTITFRVVATLTTVALILLFTGSLALAGVVGLLDVVVKLVIYYFHERSWEKVSWGR